MRESTVERYLVRQVLKRGGECRKLKGRRNECDRMVLISGKPGRVVFVETKAPGKKPRPGQVREHDRLRRMGFMVCVIDTKAKVDFFIPFWFEANP